MKKYYLKDGTVQQGPFDLDELRAKNISPDAPIWYEGLPEWTTARQLEEVKAIFNPAPLPVEEVKPTAVVSTEPVVTTTAATVAAKPATPAKPAKPVKPAATGKKNTKWVSWVLTLLVLGGAGYFVYQDMEKNKTASGNTGKTEVSTDTTANAHLSTTGSSTAETSTTDTITSPVTDPAITVTTTTKTTTSTTEQTAAQKAAAAKKAEQEKKKQQAAEAQKKAEADKKKQEAAQAAAAAREMEMRNHWPNYITFGSLNYETKGDGIKPFDVPVHNGTDAMLDKVTVRIEYIKKNEKKIFKTETIIIYNIPAGSSMNGKAPESKKGEKVNVYVTAISSKGLHFCYPQNNGNTGDPYFCN